MLEQRKSEPQLFNYAINLEKRVRANHPLRRVKAAIDLSFVREEVAHCCGKNGRNASGMLGPFEKEFIFLRTSSRKSGCGPLGEFRK